MFRSSDDIRKKDGQVVPDQKAQAGDYDLLFAVCRAGGAESTLIVGESAAVPADECRVLLQLRYFLCQAGESQLTHVQLVICRIGAEVVYLGQSVTHNCYSPILPWLR